MKKLCLAAAIASASVSAFAGPDVGVSISVNQPGLYGRVDIGNAPPPVVVYERPMVIVPGPVAMERRPIYLHVPPDHARDWRRHCGAYNACGQPVYFVREDWYQHRYPGPHERGHEHGPHGHGHDRHDDHDHDRR